MSSNLNFILAPADKIQKLRQSLSFCPLFTLFKILGKQYVKLNNYMGYFLWNIFTERSHSMCFVSINFHFFVFIGIDFCLCLLVHVVTCVHVLISRSIYLNREKLSATNRNSWRDRVITCTISQPIKVRFPSTLHGNAIKIQRKVSFVRYNTIYIMCSLNTYIILFVTYMNRITYT